MPDEDTEEKRQCASCGRWVEEEDLIGEICADCHVTAIEDEDAGKSRRG